MVLSTRQLCGAEKQNIKVRKGATGRAGDAENCGQAFVEFSLLLAGMPDVDGQGTAADEGEVVPRSKVGPEAEGPTENRRATLRRIAWDTQDALAAFPVALSLRSQQ